MSNVERTEVEERAEVNPVDTRYPEGDVRRYGAVGDGITDDTVAVEDAYNVNRTRSFKP